MARPQLFCCKKWFAGELKKYYSQKPCEAPAVECSAADPPKPPDEPDTGNCRQDCFTQRAIFEKKGYPPEDVEAIYQRCLKKCEDLPPGRGCEGGYELGFQETRCREGFSPKTIDGANWCCPVTPPDGDGVSPCSGGYQLTEATGFPGGTGSGVGPDDEVPEFMRSGEWQEHHVWDPKTKKYYYLHDVGAGDYEGKGMDLVCRKLYTRQQDQQGNTWCCPVGGGPGPGPGGEFRWSPELEALMARIMERANYLLDYPRGLTPQERQAVINYAIEGVTRGEAGEKRERREELARMGLLGSGFEAKEMARVERETRQRAGDVRRELAIDELNRRFQELMGTTGMVQGLFGSLMTGEQIPEVLSGARRAEGQAAINSLLQYFASQQGGQQQGYWQAILSQLLKGRGDGDGGGGGLDWLYYLPYLLQ